MYVQYVVLPVHGGAGRAHASEVRSAGLDLRPCTLLIMSSYLERLKTRSTENPTVTRDYMHGRPSGPDAVAEVQEYPVWLHRRFQHAPTIEHL